MSLEFRLLDALFSVGGNGNISTILFQRVAEESRSLNSWIVPHLAQCLIYMCTFSKKKIKKHIYREN